MTGIRYGIIEETLVHGGEASISYGIAAYSDTETDGTGDLLCQGGGGAGAVVRLLSGDSGWGSRLQTFLGLLEEDT